MKSARLLLVAVSILASAPARADQVFADDVIVQGSQCVGFDCVNGEAFGFSTLVLKENNTRIYFNDTSSAGGFPTTDWQLVANDSQNGGRSRFSIEDTTDGTEPFTVLAKAPSYSLFVGADGAVGIGTSTPARHLHVVGADTPTLRLDQSGALGWEPHGWDLGGNEANFFVRDVTSGTLPLRIFPSAPDDSLVVQADGGLKVGTAMVVSASGDVQIAGTLSQGSSRSIKRDIVVVPPEEILAKLAALEVPRWQYVRDATASLHLGPIAEDFHRIFGLGADAQHIAASDVAGVAIASTKALRDVVARQASEVERLKRENATLQDRLARIEALLDER